MTRHTHTDDRLTFGCDGCITDAENARWTLAPIRRITFRAAVPRHIATTTTGRPIDWRFTANRRIPDSINWRGDDELDYGRFDVGAEMCETIPADVAEDDLMDVLATAELYIVDVQPLEPPAAPVTEAMF